MPFHHLYRPVAFITLYFSKSLSYSLSYPSHRRCRSHNCLHSCLIRARRLHLSAYGRSKFSVPHNPSPRKRLLPPATGRPPGISDTSVRKSPECPKPQPQGYCGSPPRNHLRYRQSRHSGRWKRAARSSRQSGSLPYGHSSRRHGYSARRGVSVYG